MSGASTSTYPENLGSGGQLPAELRDRVSLFLYVCLFVCSSRYDARHNGIIRIRIELGGTGISPPDSFSFRSSSTTNGYIFYCSCSRQLNHSSYSATLCVARSL